MKRIFIFSIFNLLLMCVDVCPLFAKAPTISKILFTSSRDGNRDIYIMNPDGSEQVNLMPHREQCLGKMVHLGRLLTNSFLIEVRIHYRLIISQTNVSDLNGVLRKRSILSIAIVRVFDNLLMKPVLMHRIPRYHQQEINGRSKSSRWK